MKLRNPTIQELQLLEALVARASGIGLVEDWQMFLQVQPMDDGGMGSLLLFPDSPNDVQRVFSRMAGECQFADADGEPVLASLSLDQFQRLFELDIWKIDFSPLICIPENLEA